MTDESAKETRETPLVKETKTERRPVPVEKKKGELRREAERMREKTRGAFTELLANVTQEVDQAGAEGALTPELRQKEKEVRSKLEGGLRQAEKEVGTILQRLEAPTIIPAETKEAEEREWAKGLSGEAKLLVDTLKDEDNLGLVIDCGAGEGRHSIYAAERGAEKVIAIEKDPEQVSILRKKGEEARFANLEVVEGDVLEQLARVDNESVDGIIDCGMSHCLTKDLQREQFASLVYSKLKPGGIYSITHFSEKETLSQSHYRSDLEGLKRLFPDEKWTEVMPWQEASWKRPDGQEHHAYKAALRRK